MAGQQSWAEAVTEDEFIAMCRSGMTSADIAVKTKTNLRSVMSRRARLKRRDICLDPEVNEEYNAIRQEVVTDGTVIVGSDAHYWPDRVPTMHRAMVALCKKLKPAIVVANGDMLDGSSVSRFPSIGWEKIPTLKEELETVVDRMDEIFKASRNATHYWTAGNHDLRFESRLANVASEYRGIKGIHLKDHIQGWTPCWALEVNRETSSWTEIRHREKGGIHASYRNTIEAGITMVTGHDHRADVVPYNDRRGRRYGVRAGMMAESPLNSQFRDYLEARRINWQPAIAILTYQGGRLLYPELCLQAEPGLVEFRGEFISV